MVTPLLLRGTTLKGLNRRWVHSVPQPPLDLHLPALPSLATEQPARQAHRGAEELNVLQHTVHCQTPAPNLNVDLQPQ